MLDVNALSNRLFHRERFSGQLPDEQIILLGRRHSLFLWLSLLLPALLLLASFGLGGEVAYAGLTGRFDTLQRILMVLAIALLPVSLLWMLLTYTEWENDFLLLTSKRVIVARKVMRFTEERREAELERIQDIKVKASGILAHLLGYAELEVATGSTGVAIGLPRLAGATFFKEAIFKQMEEAVQRQREHRREALQEKLRRQLGGWPNRGGDVFGRPEAQA